MTGSFVAAACVVLLFALAGAGLMAVLCWALDESEDAFYDRLRHNEDGR